MSLTITREVYRTRFRATVSKQELSRVDLSISGVVLISSKDMEEIKTENLGEWNESETTESISFDILHNEKDTKAKSTQTVQEKLLKQFITECDLEKDMTSEGY